MTKTTVAIIKEFDVNIMNYMLRLTVTTMVLDIKLSETNVELFKNEYYKVFGAFSDYFVATLKFTKNKVFFLI